MIKFLRSKYNPAGAVRQGEPRICLRPVPLRMQGGGFGISVNFIDRSISARADGFKLKIPPHPGLNPGARILLNRTCDYGVSPIWKGAQAVPVEKKPPPRTGSAPSAIAIG
jgi:hypothetical protein